MLLTALIGWLDRRQQDTVVKWSTKKLPPRSMPRIIGVRTMLADCR
jgi:hypothetical protein